MSFQEKINQVIAKLLEEIKNGKAPWEKPWFAIPKMNLNNFDHEKKMIKDYYKGINRLLLGDDDESFYLTFPQVRKLGGKVKKGSKGCLITFFCFHEVEDEESKEKKKYPTRKFFYVFRLRDVTGIERPVINKENRHISNIENFLKKINPVIKNNGSRAYYAQKEDYISVPSIDQFDDSNSYYQAISHELLHWTGHESRINRFTEKNRNFFSDEYSFEELIAEIGASILCAKFGIDKIKNSAAYVRGWYSKLNDNKDWLSKAISKAEQAVDFLMALEK